jgi:hypothetical protein
MRLCDVCGQTATCFVQDVVRKSFAGSYDRPTYAPFGELNAYCDKHDREPEIIDMQSLSAREPIGSENS